VSGAREPRDHRHAGGPRLEPGWAPDALVEEVDLPATARIGRGGAHDRSLRVAIVLAVAALGVALVKPWDWGAPAALPGPTSTGAPAAAASPGAAGPSTPRPPAWTDLAARVSCLSNRLWMVVVDEVEDGGRTLARSWMRLDPVPAAGPTDARIVRAHAYAEAVPRIGFCAPTAGATGGPGDRLEVSAWRLEQGAAPETVAVPVEPALVAGGTIADGGALYSAPAGLRRGLDPGDSVTNDGRGDPDPSGRPTDPETAWSADGGAPWRPAGWSTGPAPASGGDWPPGTYVFRVGLPGAGTGSRAVAWFSVDLRGPWLGPDGAAPGMPDVAPGADPTPVPAEVLPAP
jgi:hypothetical protein